MARGFGLNILWIEMQIKKERRRFKSAVSLFHVILAVYGSI